MEPEPAQPSPEAEALAKLVYGEAIGCSTTEQAAVVWCVLNRVDAGYGDLMTVATSGLFVGYRPENPVEPAVLDLCADVMQRWSDEKTLGESAGRVLPVDYLWFHGDGMHNYFRNAYRGGDTWDWSLPSPYMEDIHA